MAYSKNDIVQVTIEDIGVTGEGIGKIDGYTLFVKDTVIGDVVEVKIMKAKKNYGYARLMNIITPSKDRVTPECNIARQCGGCQLQAMSYAAQLKYKQKLVSDNLQRIEEVLDAPQLALIARAAAEVSGEILLDLLLGGIFLLPEEGEGVHDEARVAEAALLCALIGDEGAELGGFVLQALEGGHSAAVGPDGEDRAGQHTSTPVRMTETTPATS